MGLEKAVLEEVAVKVGLRHWLGFGLIRKEPWG